MFCAQKKLQLRTFFSKKYRGSAKNVFLKHNILPTLIIALGERGEPYRALRKIVLIEWCYERCVQLVNTDVKCFQKHEFEQKMMIFKRFFFHHKIWDLEFWKCENPALMAHAWKPWVNGVLALASCAYRFWRRRRGASAFTPFGRHRSFFWR